MRSCLPFTPGSSSSGARCMLAELRALLGVVMEGMAGGGGLFVGLLVVDSPAGAEAYRSPKGQWMAVVCWPVLEEHAVVSARGPGSLV